MTEYKSEPKKSMLEWWSSPLGEFMLSEERRVIEARKMAFHGQMQLQIGLADMILPSSNIAVSRYHLSDYGKTDVYAYRESLPFQKRSIDSILLAHVLEFSTHPHQILREAERILAYDGTLVLCCLNPWSLWGIRRLFSIHGNYPWNGYYFSFARLKDWLKLLNFEITYVDRVLFRPPLTSPAWFRRCSKLKDLGQTFWPALSGVMIIVANKRTIPLTPVKSKWQTRPFFPNGQLVNKPALRDKE
jgi:SAM-dependent methyltransferase